MLKAKKLGPNASREAAKRIFKLFAGIAIEANLRKLLPQGNVRRLPVGVYGIRNLAITHYGKRLPTEAFDVLPVSAKVYLTGRPDFVEPGSRVADLKVAFKSKAMPTQKDIRQIRRYQRLAEQLYKRGDINRDPAKVRRVLVYMVNYQSGIVPKFFDISREPLKPNVEEAILRRAALKLIQAGARPLEIFRQEGYDCIFCPFRRICPNITDKAIDERLSGKDKSLEGFLDGLV